MDVYHFVKTSVNIRGVYGLYGLILGLRFYLEKLNNNRLRLPACVKVALCIFYLYKTTTICYKILVGQNNDAIHWKEK